MTTKSQQAKNEGATQKFSEMSGVGKVVHIGKVIIFFLSFGFAFPTLFSD